MAVFTVTVIIQNYTLTNNQMNKPAFYNGILYQIEYQPQLSNSNYTQHKKSLMCVYTFVRPYDD